MIAGFIAAALLNYVPRAQQPVIITVLQIGLSTMVLAIITLL